MNDKEIKIDGLTKEQVKMLDMMWSVGSPEDFQEWLDNLSYEERQMAHQLKEVLVYAVMDAVCAEEEEQSLTSVKNYLKKFML